MTLPWIIFATHPETRWSADTWVTAQPVRVLGQPGGIAGGWLSCADPESGGAVCYCSQSNPLTAAWLARLFRGTFSVAGAAPVGPAANFDGASGRVVDVSPGLMSQRPEPARRGLRGWEAIRR